MSILTRQRFLLGLAVLMMLVPTIMFAAGPLRLPAMFEGDELVELACPVCEGSGVQEKEKCRRCSGRGQVPGLIAGPHRPVQIVGTVTTGQQPLEGAEVTVDLGAQGKLNYHTNPEGQFGVKLPPGRYSITVTHDGHSSVQDFEVIHHSEPVVIEEGGNLRKQELSFVI